jgi:hypothetical protein
MKPTGTAKRIAPLIAFAALAFPVDASAFTTFGNVAPTTTSAGTCTNCSVLQEATSPGFNPYVSPKKGVVTRFMTRSGTTLNAADRFRFLVLKAATPPEWKLTGAGQLEGWDGLTGPSFVDITAVFGTRVPIDINDKITINSRLAGGNWNYLYNTGGVGDTLRLLPGIENVGDVSSGSTVSTGTGLRLNLQAVVEDDTDGDGYGDESQDLCPGIVGPAAGCRGTLLGSSMIGARTSTTEKTAVQTVLAGATLTAPFDGVVLRWAFKGSSGPTTDRLQILRAGGDGFDVVAQSATASSVSSTESLIGGATRLAIKAGDRIGASATNNVPSRLLPNGSSRVAQYTTIPNSGDHLGPPALESPQEALFAAVIEPDADHDNFGDTTEDQCTIDPTTQGPCTTPVISAFKFTPKTFAVNTKGAVISAAKVKKGSTLSLSLSEASRVKFTVSLKLKGRKVGSKCVTPTKKNKSKKSCTYYRLAHSFSRDLPAGASKFSYSGRYKAGKAKKSLAKGSYLVTADPLDINTLIQGVSARAEFKIVAAPKKH